MKIRSTVRTSSIVCACVVLASCAQSPPLPQTEVVTKTKNYSIVYSVTIEDGKDDTAQASIRVEQQSRRLRELRFTIDPKRHIDFTGDGNISESCGKLVWQPPRKGGTLSYDVRVSQQRQSGGYDALMKEKWALFRAGDVFPPAVARTTVGANSVARLDLDLPEGWSALTPYLSGDSKLSFPVDNPERRFDRPTGWILAGDIGVRRGLIADTRVAIGSPVGEGVHRMDIMAYLNWTLPTLRSVFPTLDSRLIVVSAGDPMWRGGLSGPGSLYVHADRPMISENGTSTMLHELVHVAMGVSGSAHDDWLVEGLAEYYSIKILRETGTLNGRRGTLALADLKKWGDPVDDLFVGRSSGPVTARATTLLAELDAYLIKESRGRRSLDNVVGRMIESKSPYNYRSLCVAAKKIARKPVPLLSPDVVPGAPAEAECMLMR
ncbi:MAG: hypothetical protein O3A13_01085 [Proteobacteria bacterium]|nr:hypothetical protein [Pseudomonadota bacterium]